MTGRLNCTSRLRLFAFYALAPCALGLFVAACGEEKAPWEPPYLPGQEPIIPDAGQEPTGESGSTGETQEPAPWPEGGTGSPLPAAGTGAAGAPGEQPPSAGGEGPPQVVEPPSVFRITELYLRDPHLFVTNMDVTETPVLGMSINRTVIPNQLTMDSDRDGAFDTSTLLIVEPYDPRVPMGTLRIVDGKCPLAGGACTRSDNPLDSNWMLENRLQGECLAPTAGTTNTAYRPAVALPKPPCFVPTAGTEMTLDFGGTQLAVTAVRVSATYVANPKQLTNGLLAGFVTDAAAQRAVLPRDAGVGVGGMPFGNFVRAQDKDNASSPNGMNGFWIYFNFVAKPVEYSE